MRISQHRMVRSILGVSLRDHVRNDDLRARTGVTDAISHVTKLDVVLTADKRWKKKLLEQRPRADNRNRGGPHTRLPGDIEKNYKLDAERPKQRTICNQICSGLISTQILYNASQGDETTSKFIHVLNTVTTFNSFPERRIL